ncbi:hypothetical protein ACTA71_008631 [Dictyostelium dimigraforme]
MKQLLSIFTLFIIILVAEATLNDVWNSCGKPSDTFQIKNVTVNPDPPHKGDTVTIYAAGQLTKVISGGNANILIKLGFITIIKEAKPICSSDNPLSCPIQPGDYSHQVTVTIPTSAPKGKYSGQFVLTDQIDEEIACIDVNIEL